MFSVLTMPTGWSALLHSHHLRRFKPDRKCSRSRVPWGCKSLCRGHWENCMLRKTRGKLMPHLLQKNKSRSLPGRNKWHKLIHVSTDTVWHTLETHRTALIFMPGESTTCNPRSNFDWMLLVISLLLGVQSVVAWGCTHSTMKNKIGKTRCLLLCLQAVLPTIIDAGVTVGHTYYMYVCMCIYIYIYTYWHHPSRLQPWSKQAQISWIMSITPIRSHLINQKYLHSTQLRKTPGHVNRGKRNRGGTSFVLKARTNLWQTSGSDPWEGTGYEYHDTIME